MAILKKVIVCELSKLTCDDLHSIGIPKETVRTLKKSELHDICWEKLSPETIFNIARKIHPVIMTGLLRLRFSHQIVEQLMINYPTLLYANFRKYSDELVVMELPTNLKKKREQIWDLYKYTTDNCCRCWVCEVKLQHDNFECGHIIAKSRGGSSQIDNLIPLCGGCNKTMGTRNAREYKDNISAGKTREYITLDIWFMVDNNEQYPIIETKKIY